VNRQIVFGDDFVTADLPDDTTIVPAGVSVPLAPASDLEATALSALRDPIDTRSLKEQVKAGDRVLVAFDDPTVPCYAPVWPLALPAIESELEAGGVAPDDVSYVCANSLHRRFTHEELARLVGDEFVARNADRLDCHDAEDEDNIVSLGQTHSGYHVELNKKVVDSDLTIYLNCSTTRGFSGGWKSVCVGLSTYKSIHHHHTPDIMSMSLDRNQMHAMLDEMGDLVDDQLGADRVFKIETVLANPLEVHDMLGGSVDATRAAALDILRARQPARRDLVDEPVDIVVYGVPDWSPYAAFSHGNPMLDLISTGLGYLGGMIQAVGKPGCSVVLATPCPPRWNTRHHFSYPEVWDEVLPLTKDPDDARARFEPEFAQREDLIDKYRFENAFHPVHGVMALYPLKRLRHATEVIVAGAVDESIPRHCGFESAPTVEDALAAARATQGPDATIALVEYPPAINRQ
jgi:lactate racemase